jgi:hypothetical protein
MPNTKAVGVAFSDPQLDGAVIGTTTGTAGFFGATATTRPASATQAAVASTAPVSISATQWAFSTSAQAQALLDLSNSLRAALVSLGIIKGSA